MFQKMGFGHGADVGKDHAKNGLSYRPRPSMSMALVSAGYLNSYLQGYAKAYRDQKSLMDRLDREEALTAERASRKQAALLEAKRKLNAEKLRSQHNNRCKEQADLER